MNTLDVAIFAIVALCALSGYYKGLVHTAYRMVSLFLALFLSTRLYPPVARFLRDSFIFDSLRDRIITAANFEAVFRENLPSPNIGEAMRNSNIINALPLPQQIRDVIYNHNTPDIYELLRVRTIEEYIAGFFANIVINVMAMLLVFIIVMVALRLIGKALNLVDRVPVVSMVNNIGGMVAGALLGAGFIWLGISILTMFSSIGGNNTLYSMMEGSWVVSWLFGNGWLLPSITIF